MEKALYSLCLSLRSSEKMKWKPQRLLYVPATAYYKQFNIRTGTSLSGDSVPITLDNPLSFKRLCMAEIVPVKTVDSLCCDLVRILGTVLLESVPGQTCCCSTFKMSFFYAVSTTWRRLHCIVVKAPQHNGGESQRRISACLDTTKAE